MITLWISVISLLALMIATLYWAQRKSPKATESESVDRNISLARQRLQELNDERDRGALDPAHYQQLKTELELALHSDLQIAVPTTAIAARQSLGLRLLPMLFLAVVSLGVYWAVGSPRLADPSSEGAAQTMRDTGPHHSAGTGQTDSIETLAAALATRLKREPNDVNGWYTLGRTYMTLGHYSEAAAALREVFTRVQNDADVMVQYADASIMAEQGSISDASFDLIKRALTLNPNEHTGLWLAGMAYESRGDERTALQHWRRLYPLLKDEPEHQNELAAMIAKLERKLGEPVSDLPSAKTGVERAASGAARVTVQVSLSPTLSGKLSKDYTVFIYARAVKGPAMPLAVVRKRVADLPVTVTLDDSMAMQPGMGLSNFERVKVMARISRSGQAITQSGDWVSEQAEVSPGNAASVILLIDTETP